MNDIQLSGILTEEQIDSHSSSLTNTRLHVVEQRIDLIRQSVRSDPSLENLFRYFGELENLFSYFQSMRVAKRQPKKFESEEDVQTRIVRLDGLFSEFRQYWSYFKFNKDSIIVNEFKRKFGENAAVQMQSRMVNIATLMNDELRQAYQGMKFYFRTGKRSLHSGIAGDLLRLSFEKKNRKGGSKDGLVE